MLGDGGDEHAPLVGARQQVGDERRRDAPVGLEVAVDEDHSLALALVDAARDRVPLPAVAQEVDVGRGLGGEPELERLESHPSFDAAKEVGPQLTLVFEHAGAGAVAHT